MDTIRKIVKSIFKPFLVDKKEITVIEAPRLECVSSFNIDCEVYIYYIRYICDLLILKI